MPDPSPPRRRLDSPPKPASVGPETVPLQTQRNRPFTDRMDAFTAPSMALERTRSKDLDGSSHSLHRRAPSLTFTKSSRTASRHPSFMYTTDYNQALPLGQRPRPLSLPALRAESLYQLYYPTYNLPPRTVGHYQGQRIAEKSGFCEAEWPYNILLAGQSPNSRLSIIDAIDNNLPRRVL
jgi:hypothetical protein